MNLQEVWDDGLLSFIGFLILILPLPFTYVLLDNMMTGLDAVALSLYSFLGVSVGWLFIGTVYVVLANRGSDSEDMVREEV